MFAVGYVMTKELRTIVTGSSVLRTVLGIRRASPASSSFYFTRGQHISGDFGLFWRFLQILPQNIKELFAKS